MRDTTHLKILGNEITRIRKLKGLSQESLASLSDLHRTYIGMIERGEKNITVLNLLKVCSALQIQPSNILECLDNGQFSQQDKS